MTKTPQWVPLGIPVRPLPVRPGVEPGGVPPVVALIAAVTRGPAANDAASVPTGPAPRAA